MKPPPRSDRVCGACAATRIGRASGIVVGGRRERQRLRPGGGADGDGNDEGGKNGTLHRRTLALNSSDELHYKRKAPPNGKQKLPRAVLRDCARASSH